MGILKSEFFSLTKVEVSPRYTNYSREVKGFRSFLDQKIPLVFPGQSQSEEARSGRSSLNASPYVSPYGSPCSSPRIKRKPLKVRRKEGRVGLILNIQSALISV